MYEVFFRDSFGVYYFDTFEEADHRARLNAGVVKDTTTGEIVVEYREEWD